MNHYTLEIKWSDADQKYVVVLPEWEDRYAMPVASGATYEEAAQHGREVLEQMIAWTQDEGALLPQAKTFA